MTINHPEALIDRHITEQIRQYTFETEAAGSLSPAVLALIYQQRWFQLLVPAAFGGQELNLPDTVKLFEALAWADANMGWCVNLGAGANMFAGYMDSATAEVIFHSPQTCCAGSGAVSGKARKTAGGYILSGRWKYASGANHATHFTANAAILDEDGLPVREEDQPLFRSFIIPAQQIINHRNWTAIGLKATSSNDFEAQEVLVPEACTFTLLKPSAFANGPLYKFPFSQLAIVNMTCMITGIAIHFMDLYGELAKHKKPLHSDKLLQDNATAQHIYETAANRFLEARTKMYEALQSVWNIYEQGQQADEQTLQQLSHTCRKATEASRALINELFPLCGMSILDPATELNKVWRDAMTAGQHYLLSPLYQQ